MLKERIYLDTADDRVYIDTYVTKGGIKDAMIVIPGGGYSCVCSDREGEPIALAYTEQGLNAFVLNYRVGTEADRFPCQLMDLARAILYIREHSEELCIDPCRVFTVGFSAGGHLSGSGALLCDEPDVLEGLGVTAEMIRPNAAILAYPVVTALTDTHSPSFENLVGLPFASIPEDTRKHLSLELRVNFQTPPLFIWHTAEDEIVPPVGSLRLAEAAVRAGVNVSLRLYPYGTHGVALGNQVTACGNEKWLQPLVEGWVADSVEWLKTIG